MGGLPTAVKVWSASLADESTRVNYAEGNGR